MQNSQAYTADLNYIASQSAKKEQENRSFVLSLNPLNDDQIDGLAAVFYARVASDIDCKKCGNCCKGLVINVSHSEIEHLAALLDTTETDTMDGYVQETEQANHFLSTIPCHFLHENRCSIYDHRFTECRDFPNLHKPDFRLRATDTMNHYGRCPIVYNVIEEMKVALGFIPV